MNQNTAVASAGNVEIDIFSGMPNPAWAMNSDQVAILVGMLKDSPPITPTAMFDGLGYRGFIVTATQPSPDGIPFTATIHDGVFKLVNDGADQPAYYEDTERHIENWLLSESETHLDAEIQSLIEESWN